MKLFMTVDMEDWYNAHDYNIPSAEWETLESRVEVNTKMLLDLFDQYEVKAVFYILGIIAEGHPDLVKMISEKGHVVGCHGYMHNKLTDFTAQELEVDIAKSVDVLRGLTGKKINHYRAPSWTLNENTSHLYDILEKLDIRNDSSLQPFWTPLSGVRGANRKPHHPEKDGKSYKLLEFPVPICKIGPLPLPFCGGFYMRVLPYWFIKTCLKHLLNHQDVFLYVHPWEFDLGQPKPKAPLAIKVIHNYGIGSMGRKLERIFKDFNFEDGEHFGLGVETDAK